MKWLINLNISNRAIQDFQEQVTGVPNVIVRVVCAILDVAFVAPDLMAYTSSEDKFDVKSADDEIFYYAGIMLCIAWVVRVLCSVITIFTERKARLKRDLLMIQVH